MDLRLHHFPRALLFLFLLGLILHPFRSVSLAVSSSTPLLQLDVAMLSSEISFYQEFSDDLAQLGIEVHVIELRDIESLENLTSFFLPLYATLDSIPYFYHSHGQWNLFHLVDYYNDYLLESALKETDTEKLGTIYQKWQKYIMQVHLPAIPIYSFAQPRIYWKELTGIEADLPLPFSLPFMRWKSPNQRGNTNELIVGETSELPLLSPRYRRSSSGLTPYFVPPLYFDDPRYPQLQWYSLSERPPDIVVDEIENRTCFVFHLRKDLYWEDGIPFNATDIEFTFDMLIHPNVTSSLFSLYQYLDLSDETTEIIDAYTYRISIPEVNTHAYHFFNIFPYPEHVLNVTRNGIPFFRGIDQTELWLTYSYHPLSLGPWYLYTVGNGDEIIFKLRDGKTAHTLNVDALREAALFSDCESWVIPQLPPDYIPPSWPEFTNYTINKVEYKITNDDFEKVYSDLLKGNIDFTSALNPSYYLNTTSDQLAFQYGYHYRTLFFGFNLDDPLFGTGNNTPAGITGKGGYHLRNAIAHALNRELYMDRVRKISSETLISAQSLISPFEAWYIPINYSYDLQMAREEMIKAGYVEFLSSSQPITTSLSETSEGPWTISLTLLPFIARGLHKWRAWKQHDCSSVTREAGRIKEEKLSDYHSIKK